MEKPAWLLAFCENAHCRTTVCPLDHFHKISLRFSIVSQRVGFIGTLIPSLREIYQHMLMKAFHSLFPQALNIFLAIN